MSDVAGIKSPSEVTNDDFLRCMFKQRNKSGDDYPVVIGFPGNPYNGKWGANAYKGRALRCMSGDLNTYFSISTFKPDANGDIRRKKEQLGALFMLMLDDIGDGPGAKIPFHRAAALRPTASIETSPDNYQFFLRLAEPITDLDTATRLINAMVAQGLAAETDPGMKGVTRVGRLPQGINGKPVYGGWNCKLTQWHPDVEYTLDEICEAFGLDLDAAEGAAGDFAGSNVEPDDDNVLAAIRELGIVKSDIIEDGDAKKVKITCPWIDEHTERADSGTAYFIGGGFKCHHGHCENRTGADLREWIIKETGEYPEVRTFNTLAADDDARSVLNDPMAVALLHNRTQDGTALAFNKVFGGEFAYRHGADDWVRWVDTHWSRDELGTVRYEIRNLARQMNSENTKEMAKSSFVSGVEALLRNDPAFARLLVDFDADTNLLNTPSTTIELDTMTKRAHQQSDLITQVTRVDPSSDGGSRFRLFMDEVTDGDRELVEFHQMSLGAVLSGAVEAHWLLFWFGSKGRNGKNTLGDAVAWVLGSYAGAFPTSALMSKARGDDHPAELMRLQGRRLVVSSEVPDGSFWHESRLKEITGDEFINARAMRQDWVEFKRTHKHLIYGNHQPQLRNIDPAVKARFKLVPFNVSFVGREDPHLSSKLRAEGGYILYWLMEGHRKWRDNGLRLPACKAVDDACTDYFASQSTNDAWLADRCDVTEQSDSAKWHLTKSSQFYADYSHWKKSRGETPMSATRFGMWMSERFEKVESRGIRYRGVVLRYLTPEDD